MSNVVRTLEPFHSLEPESLPPREVVIYLRYRGASSTEATLATMRTNGNGPAFFKLGGRVRYRISALDEWIASITTPEVRNTSELRKGRRSLT